MLTYFASFCRHFLKNYADLTSMPRTADSVCRCICACVLWEGEGWGGVCVCRFHESI